MSSNKENSDMNLDDSCRKRKRDDQRVLFSDLTNTQKNDDSFTKFQTSTDKLNFFKGTPKKSLKENLNEIPGPAGKIKTPLKASSSKDKNKPSSHRQSMYKEFSSTPFIQSSENISWVILEKYFNLCISQSNNIINQISIRKIKDKLRRWIPNNGRIPVPFLAGTITNDGGIGLVQNSSENQDPFSIILEDASDSIPVLIDNETLIHLGHLLRQGTSIILQKALFHKVQEIPHLSITKANVTYLAFNFKNLDLQLYRDTPINFRERPPQHDVVIFEQGKFNVASVTREILEFQNLKLSGRSSLPNKTILKTNNPASSTTLVSNAKNLTDSLFDPEAFPEDDDDILLEASVGLEKNILAENEATKQNCTSPTPIIILDEFNDDDDDDDDVLLEASANFEKNIVAQNEVAKKNCTSPKCIIISDEFDDEDNVLLEASAQIEKNIVAQNEVPKNNCTSPKCIIISDEFDDEDNVLLEASAKIEKSIEAQNENTTKKYTSPKSNITSNKSKYDGLTYLRKQIEKSEYNFKTKKLVKETPNKIVTKHLEPKKQSSASTISNKQQMTSNKPVDNPSDKNDNCIKDKTSTPESFSQSKPDDIDDFLLKLDY